MKFQLDWDCFITACLPTPNPDQSLLQYQFTLTLVWKGNLKNEYDFKNEDYLKDRENLKVKTN